jgi:hypothetical protein
MADPPENEQADEESVIPEESTPAAPPAVFGAETTRWAITQFLVGAKFAATPNNGFRFHSSYHSKQQIELAARTRQHLLRCGTILIES